MAKTILIFSDGTGQIGGLRPDQRLSNVYKLFRATRPGPDSAIAPSRQTAFYDAGLGVGEVGGLTFRRIRNLLAAALGTGIDENVIDCYAALVADYEEGDRICLVGFSRGAYTVRALANVMNLCGIPTKDARGAPVPRHGPELRSITAEAVRRVYNHGAGAKREAFEGEREDLAARFRSRYGSEGTGADGEPQGNVQPTFVGVFDTVAALGSRSASLAAIVGLALLSSAAWWLFENAPWWIAWPFALLPASAAFWAVRSMAGQIKFYLDDTRAHLPQWHPGRIGYALTHAHVAWWSGRNYDRYADREIRFLRHALAIDEDRRSFPRVGWALAEDVAWNEARGRADWLRQVWFAGNHSDIGGSYPERESRLSDIALRWMVEQLREALGPDIEIDDAKLVTAPDPFGLQHSERRGRLDAQPRWLRWLTRDRLTWRRGVRDVPQGAALHPSVLRRFAATSVPQMGSVGPYRPEALEDQTSLSHYY